jgi:hypothetical protein
VTAAPTAPSLTARVKTRFQRWSGRLLSASRWLAGGAFGTLAVLSALYPQKAQLPGFLMPVFLLSMLSMFAAPVAWVVGQLARLSPFREAQVVASAGGVDVTRSGRVQRTAASSIGFGAVVPRAHGADLRLSLTDGNELVVRVDSVAAGDALLAALALDADQRRTDVRWHRLRRSVGAAAAAFALTSTVFARVLMAVDENSVANVPLGFLIVVVPFLAASAAGRSMRRSVSVGRDGLRLRDALRRRELGFEEIAAIRSEGEVVRIELHGGEVLAVTLQGLDASVAAQLGKRMAQGLEDFRALIGSRAELFARGGRDFAVWKDDVRRLLAQAVGFRGPVLRPEDALRVVEDPEADPEARVGAALALMATGGEEEKLRVRVAAETTLAPRVRIALEAASEGDVDEDVIAAAVREREV